MRNSKSQVAGLVRALCACCTQARELEQDVALETSQRYCPESGLTYLDRGDGFYELDGGQHQVTELAPQIDVLSDRPRRTGQKSRIVLESATFASSRGQRSTRRGC